MIIGKEHRLPYAATILSMLPSKVDITELYTEMFGFSMESDVPEYNGTCMGSLCYPVKEGYVRVPYIFKAHPAGPVLDADKAKIISREAYMNLSTIALSEAQKRIDKAKELAETVSARNGAYTTEEAMMLIEENPYESTLIKTGMDYRKVTCSYEIGVMGYVIILCKDGKLGFRYAKSGDQGVELMSDQSLSDLQCMEVVKNYMQDKVARDREIRTLLF